MLGFVISVAIRFVAADPSSSLLLPHCEAMPIMAIRLEAPESGTESALLSRKDGIAKDVFEINLPSSDIRMAEALLTVHAFDLGEQFLRLANGQIDLEAF